MDPARGLHSDALVRRLRSTITTLGLLCTAVSPCWAAGSPLCGSSRAEPPIRDVVARALERTELLPRRSSWLNRLRLRPLLPRLSFRLAYSHGTASFYDWNPDAPDDLDSNLRDLQRWEVRAVWDLGPLLFDNRELEIERTSRRHADRRHKLAAEIVDLYYERQILLRQLCGDDTLDTHRRRTAIQLRRVTALLGVLSGHRFYASRR